MTPCEKTQQVHRSDQLLLPRTNAKSFVGQSFARPLCPPASNDPWEQGLTHTHTHYGRWSKPTLCVELSFELCANFGSRPYHCRVDLGKRWQNKTEQLPGSAGEGRTMHVGKGRVYTTFSLYLPHILFPFKELTAHYQSSRPFPRKKV